VLLDNGRSGILAGDSAEILGCIRCGACLNACPVYRTVGGHAYGDIYPGPVGAIVTPGIRGLSAYHELPHASSLCGACREVCPVRLDIPRMLLALRSRPAVTAQQPRSIALAMKTFAALASHPGLYRQAARAARWGLRRRAAAGWISSMPGIAAGWTKSRDFKAPAERTFQDRWRARR
jgi:L-lactate dehydrogenase complex protein LldF